MTLIFSVKEIFKDLRDSLIDFNRFSKGNALKLSSSPCLAHSLAKWDMECTL